MQSANAMKKTFLCSFFLAATTAALCAAPFPLADSDPDSPEFRNRFLASYGVNEAIEPKLTAQDRPLYEQALPFLRSQPRQAIQIVLAKLKPDSNPAFSFLLGNLYYQVNDYDNAEKHLRQAVKKLPSFRRAHRTLALIHIQRSQFAQAIQPLLTVIRLGGGDAQSYGLLGYAYLIGEKYESGLAAYRMARMFKPDSVDFRRGQAHCLLFTHQTQAALALFDELIAEQPETADFWLMQANGFLADGQRAKAIANLEIAADLQQNQTDWSALALLGDLYLSEDVPRQALNAYLRALNGEKRSSNWKSLIKPLDQLLDRRLYPEARDYLNRLQQGQNPPPTDESQNRIQLAQAKIDMELGDPQKAVDQLQDAVKKDPLNGDAWLLLGEYNHANADYEQAAFAFERALSAPGFRHQALVALGQTSVAKGDLPQAVQYLREAEQIQSNPNIRNYLDALQKRLDAQN